VEQARGDADRSEEGIDAGIGVEGRGKTGGEDQGQQVAGQSHHGHREHRGRDGEERGLRHELTHQATPSGAQGETHAHLAVAAGRPREEQVRHVRTRQEEDEPCDGGEHDRDLPGRRASLRVEADALGQHGEDVLVDGGRFAEPIRHDLHRGLGLVEARAVLQPPDHVDPAPPPLRDRKLRIEVGVHHQRRVRLRVEPQVVDSVEALGRHPDHLPGLAADLHRPADDRRVAPIPSHPQRVAEHQDTVGSRPHVVVGLQESTHVRSHAEEVEVVARDELADHPLGVGAFADHEHLTGVAGDPRERACLALDQPHRRPGERVPARGRRVGAPDLHQTVGLGDPVGRAEHQAVDEREDRRVHPDAERERQCRHERESGCSPKHAARVPDVLQQAVHRPPLHPHPQCVRQGPRREFEQARQARGRGRPLLGQAGLAVRTMRGERAQLRRPLLQPLLPPVGHHEQARETEQGSGEALGHRLPVSGARSAARLRKRATPSERAADPSGVSS
jgi:hypothetical protein